MTDRPDLPEVPETFARTKRTSYTRKQGDFSYDIDVYDPPRLLRAGRFYAIVVNMVRRTPGGESLSVATELPGEYEATPDEAASRIDAAVAVWAKNQGRTDYFGAIRADMFLVLRVAQLSQPDDRRPF